MAEFIEVHYKGERHFVNVNWIEEICENCDNKVTIFFAFTIPNGLEQDSLKVDETYEQIKYMIWR